MGCATSHTLIAGGRQAGSQPPGARAAPAQPAPANNVWSACGSYEVVVVDDEAPIVAMLRAMVSAAGESLRLRVRVHEFTAAPDALRFVLSLPGDACVILLLDEHMPVMRGSEIARRLSWRMRTCFVAVTANASDDRDRVFRETGYGGMVGKPFTAATVRRVVAWVLRNPGVWIRV